MSNFGDLLQEHYVRKFRRNAAIRKAAIDALKNASDAKKFIAAAQKRIDAAFDFPAKRCPLNPVITGKLEREKFTVEKILFDSRPNFPISANLYLPKKRERKAPAVLFLCGHAIREGKASETYQSVMISLCLKGCIVLGVDPIGQGERLQYPDMECISGCGEHNLFNRRLLLTGDNFSAWRVYDAVRSVDYLLSRSEVDPKRIGVTGNSGGGTLTTLLGGVDRRIAATAPGCYITRWVRNVENELPVDAEQIPPGTGVDGGEMADFLIAAAPRPLLIMGQKNDFFDIRGTREAYEEVRKIYTLLGHAENVALQVGPTDHGYSIHNREAAYAFFVREFKLKADAREPEFKCFTRAELNSAAPDGLTLHVKGSTSLNAIIDRQVTQMVAARKKLSESALKTALKKMLGLGSVGVPEYRQLRGRHNPGAIAFSRFGVETQPGLICTLQLAGKYASFMHLPEAERAELYLPNQSASDELAKRPLPATRLLYGFDYRGVGESMPNGCDQDNRDFFGAYQFDYHYASLALLRNESLLGDRVFDVLSAIRLLRANGTGEITLTASGIGTIPALLAAFLSDEPVKLGLTERVRSYADHAHSICDALPQSMGIKGILALTDLDEIQDFVERA